MPENIIDLVNKIQSVTSFEGPYISIDFWDHRKYLGVYTSSHGFSDLMTSYVDLIDYLTDFLEARKILFRRFDI